MASATGADPSRRSPTMSQYTMSPNAQKALPVVQGMLGESDEELYKALGLRVRKLARDVSGADRFDLDVAYDAQAFGAKDVIIDFGKRFFARTNRRAFQLVCGDDTEDEDIRDQLRDALGLKEAAFGAALTGVLIGSLGLAAPVAVVVSTLITKLFYREAYNTMCEVWEENLPAPPPG
jgi:hypothetical protein